MFSGFTSLLPWYGAKRSTTGSVDIDLERGNGSQPHMDDDRLSSVSSIRVVESCASSIAEVDQGRALPDLPQDGLDNDVSTSGYGAGPLSEESVTAAVPGFLSTIGRSASTPLEILHLDPPPDSTLQQLQDQDHFYSATSSSSSASSNHSYARFFHRARTPKRTRSTRSLGPGGMHNSLSILSPIYEPSNPDLRELASTQKEGEAGGSSTPPKTHAPSIHSTTSTIQERIMSLQATHPAFLKRSLKRTLSQTSSNSLHSQASGAPQLPPLHFRPAFSGIPVGILSSPTSTRSPGPPSNCNTSHPPKVVVSTRPSPSTTSPQRSQLSYSQPNTPQSLTTPRSHRFGFLDHSQKCSAIYEDSASEKSFVTATSGETEPGPGVITKHDIPSTAELVVYPENQEDTEREPEHAEERRQDVQEQPSSSNVRISVPEQPQIERETEQRQSKVFSESEITFNIVSDPQHGPNTVPATVQRPKGAGAVSVMSIASTTVKNESVMVDDRVIEETATVVEDDRFIMERWMKTLFYSASDGKELFSTARGGEQKHYLVSSTCVLFWVGFVAPWCWLIGGWMPPREALVLENEVKQGKQKEKVSMDVDREVVPHGEDGSGLKKWILPDPSSSFKATARAPSMSSTTTLCPKEVEGGRLAGADPWVRRCRIASIVGGAILGLGLVAVVIVLAVATK
ncbi:hypothetical protein BDM02DRAFT_3182678 [Thelephora ganbajun]|uniref:Uncharacterized protein n=1 Tax=Thelephora ganbajun TaxID=370292 RepID=A0ACB6ZV44_THEGA|nr:hypothetical protein BDM02DRAFT_3182678 [Thelephora ganbajun]